MDNIEIRVENISKQYGEKQVLNQFSYVFAPSSKTALSAPSGTGKTTLLGVLSGIVLPDKGKILYSKPLKASVVFQENRLLESLTLLQNLKAVLPKGEKSEESLLRELDCVGLLEAAGEKVETFSGGMKRRTAILRAVLMPGNLLLMDEPFQGLDAKTKEQVMQYVLNKIGGRTFVFATHEPKEAEYFAAEKLEL